MSAVDTPVKRDNRARIISASVLLVVAVLVAVLATRPASNAAVAANPIVGQTAPTIRGTAIDGRSVDLAELRGRYVVVNFFATWCLPCRQEHPELIQFADRNTGPSAPAVVAVAYDRNDIAATRSFFARYGGSWPVLPDDTGRVSIDYGVRGLPESYVVDPEGRIAARITGKVTADGLRALTGSA